MHWGAFTHAVEDLRANLKTADAEVLPEMKFIADAIEQSQRFFVPDARFLLDGRQYREFSDLFHLPFPMVSVLTETNFTSNGVEAKVPTITVAIDPECEFGRGRFQPVDGAFAYIASIAYYERTWVTLGVVAYLRFDDSTGGIELRLANNAALRHVVNRGGSIEQVASDMYCDVDIIANVCAMLGTSNVSAIAVDPPHKLNAKRVRKHRLPLWTYHVLNVDGQQLAPCSQADGNGLKYRSHLRRGHIRRLMDGRRVWVRQAFVRGGVAGFVSKDYQLAGEG